MKTWILDRRILCKNTMSHTMSIVSETVHFPLFKARYSISVQKHQIVLFSKPYVRLLDTVIDGSLRVEAINDRSKSSKTVSSKLAFNGAKMGWSFFDESTFWVASALVPTCSSSHSMSSWLQAGRSWCHSYAEYCVAVLPILEFRHSLVVSQPISSFTSSIARQLGWLLPSRSCC